MLTPVDLETTVFRRSFRGYNVQEVQEFMAKITHDYEHLYRENIDLKEKLDELNAKLAQYQLMEETLRNAMVLAQETAEEVKNAAKRHADLIIRDAEQKGDRIKGRIKEEIQGEIQKLATLKNQVEFFKSQFKSFLKGLLDIAENQLEINIQLDKQIQSEMKSEEKEPVPEQELPTGDNSQVKTALDQVYSVTNE